MASSELRILYVAPSNDLYGSDIVLLNLINRLDRNKFRPYVALPSDVKADGRLTAELSKLDIPYYFPKVTVLRKKYLSLFGIAYLSLLLPVSVVELSSIVRAQKIDLIHSNSGLVLSGAIAAKALGVAHLWHIHELLTTPASLGKILGQTYPRFSEAIVAVSQPVKQWLDKVDPRNRAKVTVIHSGTDLETFNPNVDGAAVRAELGFTEEDIVIGVVGRLSYRKGQDCFLRAAQHIAEKYPRTRFLIVGDTFDKQDDLSYKLRRLASELSLDQHVVFSPFRKDIARVMAALSILVLPSRLPEAFPTTILEAMATGRPVVATACGGAEESVRDGITGFIVPIEDTEAMVQAIDRLVADPTLRTSMGQAGRRRVEEHFSLMSSVCLFQELYSQIAASRNKRSWTRTIFR